MIKKFAIPYSFLTLIILIIAVAYGGARASKPPTVTNYGTLSTSPSASIAPTDSIVPAMKSIRKYKAKDKDKVSTMIEIYNGLSSPVLWNISYTPTIKSSYYWIADGVRATNKHDGYITCSPPPEGIQNWVIIHETLPIKVEAGETKEVMITLNVPKGIKLPDIWEFRLHYANLSQEGNVHRAYDQIWQINSK